MLVTTTIIENGLDIPRANTIIVNRADRFGLAQLYQLRGRVGRSHEHAYAYFVVPSRHNLSDEARQAAARAAGVQRAGRRLPAGRGRPGDPRGGGVARRAPARPHRRRSASTCTARCSSGRCSELKGEPVAERRPASLQPRRGHQDPRELPARAGDRLVLYKRLAQARDAGRRRSAAGRDRGPLRPPARRRRATCSTWGAAPARRGGRGEERRPGRGRSCRSASTTGRRWNRRGSSRSWPASAAR